MKRSALLVLIALAALLVASADAVQGRGRGADRPIDGQGYTSVGYSFQSKEGRT